MNLPDCEKPGSLYLDKRQDADTRARRLLHAVEIEDGPVPVVALARMPSAPGSQCRFRPAWS